VDTLTGHIPYADLAALARRRGVAACFVSLTLPEHVRSALPLLAMLVEHAAVYVGGQAMNEPGAETLVRDVGGEPLLDLASLDAITRLHAAPA
jgi:hypothetical protein